MRDGKEYVRLRSILKFVFQYMSKVTICHEIADEVETFFTGEVQGNMDNAIYDLYRDIAKSHFKNDVIETGLRQLVTVPECIPTLYGIHKQEFTSDEWNKICVFEYHYGKLYGHEPLDWSKYICVVPNIRLFVTEITQYAYYLGMVSVPLR